MIAWNGIASYSTIPIGAPVGVAMAQHFRPASLGVFAILSPALGYLIACAKSGVAIVSHGEAMAFRQVLPIGIGLFLGTIGFGSIATFITQYYASPRLDRHGLLPERVRLRFRLRAAAAGAHHTSLRRLPGGAVVVSG